VDAPDMARGVVAGDVRSRVVAGRAHILAEVEAIHRRETASRDAASWLGSANIPAATWRSEVVRRNASNAVPTASRSILVTL